MLTPNTKQKPNLRSLYTDHNRSGRAGPGCSGHAARAGVLRDLTCFPSSAPGRPLQDTVPADAAPPNAGAGAWCHSRRFLPAASPARAEAGHWYSGWLPATPGACEKVELRTRGALMATAWLKTNTSKRGSEKRAAELGIPHPGGSQVQAGELEIIQSY